MSGARKPTARAGEVKLRRRPRGARSSEGVRARSYGQFCSLARALDRVGWRWTLLVVRELLIGPARFKDLLGALPGIGTNLLSRRLRELETWGIVARTTLPPPGEAAVYELTPLGRGLDPVVIELARWGLGFLDHRDARDVVQPRWAVLVMRATFRPEAAHGVDETYTLGINGQTFHAVVHDGRVRTGLGPGPAAALELEADTETYLALATGELSPMQAVAENRIKFRGAAAALERCVSIFGLAPRPSTRLNGPGRAV